METKRRVRVVLSIVLAVIGAFALIASAIAAFFGGITEVPYASARRLVYHTDRAAVLQACRQAIGDPEAAGFPKAIDGHTGVNGSQSGARPPASLPAVLRDLKFESMNIDGERAIIYFGSGFGHWGYATFPAGGYSQRQLISGLWFWSDYELPRDSSTSPFFLKSELLSIGGLLAFAASVVVAIYSRRRL